MPILSIQSKVVHGHVGHGAATLLLERLGYEVWAIDTVVLSNHPGHGRVRGRTTPPEEIVALVEGLDELGLLSRCRAILSGYLGTAANGEAMLEAVRRVKGANPAAITLCDPVMGDRDDGLYVAADLPSFFAERAIPVADIVTPNAFELERLTGLAVATPEDAIRASARLLATGPKLVITTGLDGPVEGEIATLAADRKGAWVALTPRIATTAHGMGDAFAALFLGQHLRGLGVAEALALAAAGVEALVEATAAAGDDELALIAAQDRAVAPSRVPPCVRLR
jgi:pyridoxine kinase